MEKSTPEFRYFHPHDDWKLKDQKESPQVQSNKSSDTPSAPLPHQQKSRLTPGEIEAIKRMRADPNIPEDAKPPLPDGYED